MAHSKPALCTMFIPNTGSEAVNTGNNAQCMAQSIDVAIPSLSQLSLSFISIQSANIPIFAMPLQNIK